MAMASRLKHWTLTDSIPDNMPLLESWLDTVKGQPLAGVTGLLIQHQLGNHVPQARGLIALGMAPADLHWIDIPYSSTLKVREHLQERLKIPEENFVVSNFRLLDDYATYQRVRVQKFLQEIAADPPERLLVLDDGSYMLEALACLRKRPKSIAIVEQTTRGIIKIEENAALTECSMRYPIINVARSVPKKTLEPPFIGAAICDALTRKLRNMKTCPGDRCLVLGYGCIGRQVATFLTGTQGYARNRVYVYDPVASRMKKAKADRFSLWSRGKRDVRFRLVVGCSGRSSFRLGDHAFLEDQAFLASASSGTVELSRQDFIELADSSQDDDVSIVSKGLDESRLHGEISFNFLGRRATFLNGGFPVNFDGRVNCVPAHYIQPTPTMMCAAAVQAVRTKRKGLIDLDEEFCGWLTDGFKEILGDEAEILNSED